MVATAVVVFLQEKFLQILQSIFKRYKKLQEKYRKCIEMDWKSTINFSIK